MTDVMMRKYGYKLFGKAILFTNVFLLIIPFANLAPALINEDVTDKGPAAKKPKLEIPGKCTLLLSEIKPGTAIEKEGEHPFIELHAICSQKRGPPPKFGLATYKLLIVERNPLAIALVVDFSTFPFNVKSNFILIGSPHLPNVDISLSTPHVQTIFSTVDNHRMLPDISAGSYAVMIVEGLTKTESKHLSTFINRQGIMTKRILTTEQIKLLREKVVDMILLDDDDAQGHFGYFWRATASKGNDIFPVELRNIDKTSFSSLSMCEKEYEGFNAESFTLKPMSPGGPNICSSPNEHSDENVSPQLPAIPLVPIHLVSNQELDQIKQQHFESSWIELCEKKFPQRVLESTEIQEWIHFDYADCKFTCNACKAYFGSGFRPDVKRKPLIVTNGFLSKDIYDNRDAINNHEKAVFHKDALQFFRGIKNSETSKELSTVFTAAETKEQEIFNATMNVVLLVYTEIKTGVSFKVHESLMKAMRIIGMNVGMIHHSDNGAQKITQAIARTFHFKLLTSLVAAQQPFSILIDSSSSFNQPFLVAYILTLEDTYPVTHFYSLIYMAEGERAEPMTNSFINQIESDNDIVPGFTLYFKTKLVSLTSDGAAVMIGVTNSFKVYLSKYVNRQIPNVVCLNHKLDSSYKAGIKKDQELAASIKPGSDYNNIKLWQISYFESFEKSTNSFYTFYASRGYKKWQHLLETAEDLGITAKRIKYVYNIRWSDSHYRALETIHHNYFAMVDDLHKSTTDKIYDKTTQETAQTLYSVMTDKTWMLVLHEFLDVLSTFKKASKLFQESSSIIVGKIEIIYDVMKSLESFKFGTGPMLSDFLGNVVCFGACGGGQCTLQDYDLCDKPVLNGVILKRNNPTVLYYMNVRKILYNNLLSSISKYFDLELLDSFELFNPKRINFDNIPWEDANLETLYTVDGTVLPYAPHFKQHDRVLFICSFYGIENCEEFKQEWTKMIMCLGTNEDIRIHVTGDPSRFWPFALTMCNNLWTASLRHIVGSVLVTSYSSSECERGFSIMNMIKTKSRARLEKDTLNSLMTVRINGPELENFHPYEYAVEFLKKHIRVDDTEHTIGSKQSESEYTDLFRKSRIY